MIVKNESKNLIRLFDSIHTFIDFYIISDTGSIDDTIDLIIALGKKFNIPGKIVQHQWQDFAFNRQFALETATHARMSGEHNCDWLLIIDADEELIVADNDWVNKLSPGVSYTVYKKLGGLSYKHLFLLWINGEKWKWIGKVHNYLVNENQSFKKEHQLGVFIKAHQSEGSNSKRFKDKNEQGSYYLAELLKELEGVDLTTKNSMRFFSLAYTYRDNNDLESAIIILKRLEEFVGVSKGLKYISLVFIGKFQMRLNRNIELIEPYLKKALELIPERNEAPYYLSVLNRMRGNYLGSRKILESVNTLLPLDGQFNIVESDISLWKIKYELAFISFQLNDNESALNYIQELLLSGHVPEIEANFLKALKEKIKNKNTI